MKWVIPIFIAGFLVLLTSVIAPVAGAEVEIKHLQKQIEQLEAKVEKLQRRGTEKIEANGWSNGKNDGGTVPLLHNTL